MDLRDKLKMDTSIGLFVKLAEKSLERAIDSELRQKCGLTGGQWKAVMVLAISDGLTQRELADLIFVEAPTLVPILDRMEKDGFVKRVTDQEDRRTNRVYLTPKSKKLVSVITDCILDFRKTITKDIPEKDLEIARLVLKQLSQNADKLMERKGIKVPETILNKK